MVREEEVGKNASKKVEKKQVFTGFAKANILYSPGEFVENDSVLFWWIRHGDWSIDFRKTIQYFYKKGNE